MIMCFIYKIISKLRWDHWKITITHHNSQSTIAFTILHTTHVNYNNPVLENGAYRNHTLPTNRDSFKNPHTCESTLRFRLSPCDTMPGSVIICTTRFGEVSDWESRLRMYLWSTVYSHSWLYWGIVWWVENTCDWVLQFYRCALWWYLRCRNTSMTIPSNAMRGTTLGPPLYSITLLMERSIPSPEQISCGGGLRPSVSCTESGRR